MRGRMNISRAHLRNSRNPRLKFFMSLRGYRKNTLQNVSTSAWVSDEAIKLPVLRHARP